MRAVFAYILSSCLIAFAVAGCATKGERVESPAATGAPAEPLEAPAPAAEPAAAMTGDLAFLPQPRSVVLHEGTFCVTTNQVYAIELDNALVDRLVSHLNRALDTVGLSGKGSGQCAIEIRIDRGAMTHSEGYLLDITPETVRITGHDAPGAFHAVMTLKQLARQCTGTGSLPCLRIEDWPDFPNRGVMIDVARCKVPEMETLYALVDKLAELKFNQLQMYTEHTFAYRNHHTVWEDASPMTPAQIRALDAYCRDRFIELVPNQNSFGHMDRWLRLPEYAHLAETPGGSDLCPIDPGSIALLEDMYDDLLPCFSSGQANVGCDETWSLGKGRSKDVCNARGVGPVYFEFLMKIRELCRKHGKQMQFWGDIIMNHPELIPEIPDGVIAMEWGYEANHPFAEHGRKFAESGVPFYVVPGTSAWNSLAGRTDNALANLRNAAENGLANGAIGYLVTDWGDGGHWQFLPVSYLPYAYAAAVSWAYAENKDIDLARAVDVHWFEDRAGVMGRLAYDLGNAHLKSDATFGNNTIYYRLLLHQIDGAVDERCSKLSFEAVIADVDRVMQRLPEAEMQCPDADLIRSEFECTAKLIRFACRLGIARLDAGNVGTAQLPASARARLAAELEPLIPEFRQLWLARNRSGGLKESAGHFERLLRLLKGP